MLLNELTPNLEPVSRKDFWAFINQLNWSKDFDPVRVKTWILRGYGPEQVAGLRSQYSRVLADLVDKIDDVVGVSDDQFNELAAHIIGMGQTAYLDVMRDPSVAQKVVDRRAYHPGFTQIFPEKSDWKRDR